MTDLEILIWMRRYFLLFLWRRCILRTTLLETADLNWVAAARFLLLRFPVQLIALDRLFFFGQVVLLVLLFQESAPFSTHFVVARWFFTNTEEFLRVLVLTMFKFIICNILLFLVNQLIFFNNHWILKSLKLLFDLSSVYNIIRTHAYIWFYIYVLLFIWIFFLNMIAIFLNNINNAY